MLRAAALIGFVAFLLHAQDDEAIFTADVKVVSVLANVLDKQGRPIRDLKKDDFQIFEDGRKQEIRYFSRETELPLTIGLMVDTSMSQEKVLSAERAASYRFLDRVLRENKDKVFVMQFDSAIQMPQDLTSSRQALEKSLATVDTPTRAELRAGAGGGTRLFDAVVQASLNTMAGQKGRKALIVLSDGGENSSDASLERAIDAAQKADTLIYSILFGGTEGRGILQRMSRETGGGYYEVTKNRGIDQVYDDIQTELRSQYSFGFISDKPVRISAFRKLRVDAGRKDLIVRTRDQYWAKR